MISWRISKYDPKYRNEKDEYQKDEWTSCHDIGKTYQGREFMIHDYITTENAYIYAVISFMKCINIQTLTVKHLEKYCDNIMNESPIIYTNDMMEFFQRLHDGLILDIGDIERLCRLALRETLWCKLENDNTMFIHFGYDYYMYIGCNSKSEEIINMIERRGLFLEPNESPYI